MTFNKQLYNASLAALLERGCPKQLAEAASRVVATDQVGRDRTPTQQQTINQIMPYLNNRDEDSNHSRNGVEDCVDSVRYNALNRTDNSTLAS